MDLAANSRPCSYIVQPEFARRPGVRVRNLDRHQRRWLLQLNGVGADSSLVTNEWLEKSIRAKGPLGKVYPKFMLHHGGRYAELSRPH